MGVLEERTKQAILLTCYIRRGDENVSNIAKAMIRLLVTNYINFDIHSDIEDILLDRFELVFDIKYTIEDFESRIEDFGLAYIYPIIYIESVSSSNLESINDAPI